MKRPSPDHGAAIAPPDSIPQLNGTEGARPTPSQPTLSRLNNFDIIRLLAALHVVVSHAIVHTGLIEKLSSSARLLFDAFVQIPAVPIFFVVSGFLIPSSFERNPGNLTGYFWRRALRIFPALWLSVGAAIVILAWAGYLDQAFVTSKTFLAWLVAQTTMVQFWNPEHFRTFGNGVVNGALWTISVELQYYLTVPVWCTLGAWLAKRGRWRLAFEGTAFVISVAAHMYMRHRINDVGGHFGEVATSIKALHMTLLPHLWMFILGYWIYRHMDRMRSLLVGQFPKWAALWIAFIVLGEYIFGDTSLAGSALYPFSRIVLAFATISLAYTAPSVSNHLLRGNDISYGVYIFHWLILNVMLELGLFQTVASIPILVAASALCGFLSWRLLEKPILRFKNWKVMNSGSRPLAQSLPRG
ncbi:MAG: acyltransferase [Verrucomicrobiota bacterium JB023]|nr:acyltransferase [Verrucomicrobiota bacterium JB023]